MLNSAAGTEQCWTQVHVEMGGWGGEDEGRLSVSQQRPLVVNEVNVLLGFIAHSVASQTRGRKLSLYLGLVKPHLKYCVQFWALLKRHVGNTLNVL